ncbi:glycerol kinase GlpK [Sediminitomix flava]|uniref:Glycerol kinase n=1 Tax=Sediminitomix flava TaxID=379075 RepID=A0A315ZF40_SEDFL|nr:glycerol kinase GlpK [Sediminitomix flava]PWJ43793.1 glycerol kinase [Sediminitomix flava]
MEKKYILALDQGTTSSRAILFDKKGEIIELAQEEFTQYYPKPGWVEHDANEIWSSQVKMAEKIVSSTNINAADIAAMGITNQRETTIIWDRNTGEPIYNAIVWQDRRTAEICDFYKDSGYSPRVQNKTGLLIDAYFSATKIKWILDHVKGARERAQKGELCFGTVDSWLVWKFTEGKVHATDVTNASRTMLYNIHTLEWDSELLDLFDVPYHILPEVKSCSEHFGDTTTDEISTEIPITGIAGDQQAALFGQLCTKEGMAKNTYGTGCFLVMNTGETPKTSKNDLLTTIAWSCNGKINYALEGSIFVGGAAIQWLRDGLGILRSAAESEEVALTVSDNGGVYFVPALTGLGAPHWDQFARGTLIGITRGTNRGHIVRAALEGINYQVNDVLKAIEADTGLITRELRVDGGAVANNVLMQYQADISRCKVVRPKTLETTALGAAYFAGLAVGFWKSLNELHEQWQEDRVFQAKLFASKALKNVGEWKKAVDRSKSWVESKHVNVT